MKLQLVFLIVCFLGVAVTGKKVLHEITSGNTGTNDTARERILGGGTAPLGGAPYIVSLRDNRNNHFCGGSIIHERWILTAAHCVMSGCPYSAVAGTNNIRTGGDRYQVKKCIAHAQFDTQSLSNDIALVLTMKPIMYNQYVRPIGLSYTNTLAGKTVLLVGWGTTSYPGNAATDLQYIFLNTIDMNKCAEMLAQMNKITGDQICTLNEFGQGACHGDSGGPLVDQAFNAQVGIVSWGKPCAKGYPDVFTRVSSYIKWIYEMTSKFN